MQPTPHHYLVMPVDRTEITTLLRIHPDLFNDPINFISSNELQVRSSKPTRGKGKHGPTRKITLHVLQYKGIKMELIKSDGLPLAEAKIHFNPGVCLYGHNGRIPTLREFHYALALLVNHLKPLLENPDDRVHLVPGVVPGGCAYWSYIEIPFQCLDPDRKLLAGFRHLIHTTITSVPRQWHTSIKVGVPKGVLKLNIYVKSTEMFAKGKLGAEQADQYPDVLRFEMKMRKGKIVSYLGNDQNTEEIDGRKRVVRFSPYDLIQAHRRCFVDEIRGVYAEPNSGSIHSSPVEVEGRLLADTALDSRCSYTFPQLLAIMRFYTGATSEAMSPRRKAGLAELSRRSTIDAASIFSEQSYRDAYWVANEETEMKILHDFDDVCSDSRIIAAYRPASGIFTPVTPWPTYLGL